MSEELKSARFQAVVNQEGQYSIWPEGKEMPPGWEPEGKVGTQEECLEHIAKIWTDMRPLSARTL